MLDLVLTVKDSEAWHKANLERSALATNTMNNRATQLAVAYQPVRADNATPLEMLHSVVYVPQDQMRTSSLWSVYPLQLVVRTPPFFGDYATFHILRYTVHLFDICLTDACACRNPGHYSGLARLLGAGGVARLQQDFGAKVSCGGYRQQCTVQAEMFLQQQELYLPATPMAWQTQCLWFKYTISVLFCPRIPRQHRIDFSLATEPRISFGFSAILIFSVARPQASLCRPATSVRRSPPYPTPTDGA